MKHQFVYGKNTVKHLLDSSKKIHEVIILDTWKEQTLISVIKKRNIRLIRKNRKEMDELFAHENHQGIVAKIDAYKVWSMEELLVKSKDQKNPVFVMLDQLEDPHNLGAILRTCDAIGVSGVIIGKHRCVGLTPTVAKVSTGAIETIPVASVNNLSQTCKYLKDRGFWVVGTDAQNGQDYRAMNYDFPMVLVIGSEGKGISQLVKKQCDFHVFLPMIGTVTSLNASVACSILLYQIYANKNPL